LWLAVALYTHRCYWQLTGAELGKAKSM
jgi:hypothetical protein